MNDKVFQNNYSIEHLRMTASVNIPPPPKRFAANSSKLVSTKDVDIVFYLTITSEHLILRKCFENFRKCPRKRSLLNSFFWIVCHMLPPFTVFLKILVAINVLPSSYHKALLKKEISIFPG